MTTCIFCQKMSDGSLVQATIYEDETFIAFLDSSPLAEGHTQIIPKKHIEWVWDYAGHDQLFDIAVKIARHLKDKLEVDKVDLLVSGGSVPHAHIHVIPSWGKWLDVLDKMRSLRKSLTDEEKAIPIELVKKLHLTV